MKKKSWRNIMLVLIIAGVLLFVFSLSPIATTFPMERSIASIPTEGSGNIRLKNMGKVSRQATTSPQNVGQLDQYQEVVNPAYYVGVILPDGGCYCQTIKNERKPMVGYQIAIGKHGTPSEPIYIGVMSSKKDPRHEGSYHIIASLDASNVPNDDVLYWMGGEFPSDPLDQYLCYIVAISLDDPSDGNYWMWGAGSNDPYKPWVKDHWEWDNERWIADFGDKDDMCFRTFTEGGNGGGDPPAITITSSYQVMSQALSLLSFVGAVIAGTKYKWFM